MDAWALFVQQADPDVVIGYNISNFDFPYLMDRAAALAGSEVCAGCAFEPGDAGPDGAGVPACAPLERNLAASDHDEYPAFVTRIKWEGSYLVVVAVWEIDTDLDVVKGAPIPTAV